MIHKWARFHSFLLSSRRRQVFIALGQLHPNVRACRSCRIADMTPPDPEALRRGVDGDGGIRAAIWGGVLPARHACVGGCKPEHYHNLMPLVAAISSFGLYLCSPDTRLSVFSIGAIPFFRDIDEIIIAFFFNICCRLPILSVFISCFSIHALNNSAGS